MSKIAKAIRAKRFETKSEAKLTLIVETTLGDRFILKVKNCSLTGVGALADAEQSERLHAEMNKILPESKLCWDDSEVSLGRLVVRASLKQEGTSTLFGFSCVDTKIPLLGSLSKHFETLGGNLENALTFELSSKKFNLSSFLESDHAHTDLFQKCHEYELLRADLHKNPFFQFYGVRWETNAARVRLSLPRVRKPTDYINFGSYDYFGLAADPEVKAAAKAAIDRFGVSAGASPPNAGRTCFHEELESYLARALRKDSVLLFGSGYSANIGALTAILGPNDVAIADILSHASIHDGLAASRSKVRYIRHNNMKHLRTHLTEHRGVHAGALTVTEGLFSMDGDVAQLKEFVELSKEFNCRVFLDEAHSFGVLGETGAGAAERAGVLDDISLYSGSLSKSLGASGGFVAGSKEVIHWMEGFARGCLFSSSLTANAAAAALKSLQIIREQPQRRAKLRENIKLFTDGLKAMGYAVKADPESPIQPVVVGTDEKLGIMNQVLVDHGIFVNPVVFPAVAINACRFRFSLTSMHSYADIQLALMALKRATEVAGVSFEELSENAEGLKRAA